MQDAPINRASTLFLQAVIVFIGIAVFVFMLWEPNIEGRNAQATLFEVYFNDPFLAYAYIASIAFFTGLYQAFRLLGSIGRNEIFVERSVQALRRIRQCAIALAAFIVVGVAGIMLGGAEELPPLVFMGTLTTFTCTVIAAAAAVSERVLQNGIALTSDTTI